MFQSFNTHTSVVEKEEEASDMNSDFLDIHVFHFASLPYIK